MAARLRGVSRPLYRGNGKLWLAQSKPNKLWKYGFHTKMAAAKWLAQKLKVKVSGLAEQKGPTPALAMSCYNGVVCHRRKNGNAVYEARVDGKLISSHGSAVAAAAVVAKKLGTSIASLKKRQPLTPKLARSVLTASYPVFRQYVPGDLVDLMHHEKINARIFAEDLGSWGV